MLRNQCRDHRGVGEIRADISLGLHEDYTLTVRHRHWGGDWSVHVDRYPKLSASELQDVLEAHLAEVNYRHPWLSAGEQKSLW